jgi:hypothetical protein
MKMMKLRVRRYPAALLVFVLVTMSACALLQAQGQKEDAPSCHASSENSSEPKPDHSIKFCCESGLIPNKSQIFKEEANFIFIKFQNREAPSLQVLSSFDVYIGIVCGDPPCVPLNLPLRI